MTTPGVTALRQKPSTVGVGAGAVDEVDESADEVEVGVSADVVEVGVSAGEVEVDVSADEVEVDVSTDEDEVDVSTMMVLLGVSVDAGMSVLKGVLETVVDVKASVTEEARGPQRRAEAVAASAAVKAMAARIVRAEILDSRGRAGPQEEPFFCVSRWKGDEGLRVVNKYIQS